MRDFDYETDVSTCSSAVAVQLPITAGAGENQRWLGFHRCSTGRQGNADDYVVEPASSGPMSRRPQGKETPAFKECCYWYQLDCCART